MKNFVIISVNSLPGYKNIADGWYVDSRDGKLHGPRGVIKGSWSRSKEYPYNQVTMRTVDGKKIHKRLDRIIALALVPGRTELRDEVDHINGVHDDDRPENLRWVSPQENKDARALREYRGLAFRRAPKIVIIDGQVEMKL